MGTSDQSNQKAVERTHFSAFAILNFLKFAWVLKLVRDIDAVPTKYFKKLVNTDDIWEVRIDVGKNTSHSRESEKRILKPEIIKMDDLDKYIKKRKQQSPQFAKNYDTGYEQFKIGVFLKQARLKAGLTQEQIAKKLNTKKSAISRIENHAEDVRLSTLENFAQAVSKHLQLDLT